MTTSFSQSHEESPPLISSSVPSSPRSRDDRARSMGSEDRSARSRKYNTGDPPLR